MAKSQKVFGGGGGLVGYADDKRKEKAQKPILPNSWETVTKNAGKTKR